MIKTHNESRPRSLEYCSWMCMIQRCTNPRNKVYQHYGGKGITVCARWRNSFVDFLEDMGRRPSKDYTLDRIERDEGYYKENCKWSTRREQCINRSSVKITEQQVIQIKNLFEEGQTQINIAKLFNVKRSVIHKIVRNKTWKHLN